MPDSGLKIESVKDSVSAEEWEARVNLAACYRLVAMNGWDDLIYTHISARVPGPEHHFLINPLGLLFEEITASSLVKIDLDGKPVMSSPFMVNQAGFIIHSAIHRARDDAKCVIHLHTDYGIAVSNLREGLKPTCQNAIFPWSVMSYHDYEGIAVREGEQDRLVADLGDASAMILRNHGTLTLGQTTASAYELMFFLERACKIQILTQSAGGDIVDPSQESIDNAIADLRHVAGANGADLLLWPALLRKLDKTDPSYRT